MYEATYISNFVEFNAQQMGYLISWCETLDDRLESERDFPLPPGKIPIFLGREWRVVAIGYWQVGEKYVWLAKKSTNNSHDNPTLRTRAMILLSVIEYIDTHLEDDIDEDLERRKNAVQAKLLTYLPVREVPEWADDGLYAACGEGCPPDRVAGLAVNAAGEIIAIRTAGGQWVTLTGQLTERPVPGSGVTVVEWEVK
jgi:hypothetical protein